MKVTVYLKKSSPGASNICFRVRDKNVDIKVVSPLEVQDKYWDSDTLSYRRTTAVPAAEQKRLPEQIAAIIERAEKTFSDKADSRWMRQVIEDVLYPARAFERNHPNLLARVHEYLEKFDGAERTKEHIVRFERKMTRYHDYRREILGEADFTLFVETVTLEQMNAFRDYVVNEHLLRQEYPDFYAPRLLINHRPRPLSGTTVINIMNLFCTFLHWCKKMKYSDNEVYALYGCKEPTYGDPFFLTSEERNILYDADLSDNPKLAVIRDIFVFHCYVGCRVGDLYRLTRDNIGRFSGIHAAEDEEMSGEDRQGAAARKGVEDTGTIRCQFRQTVPVQADTHLQPRHTGTAEALRHRQDGHHPRHARLQYRAKTLVRGGHEPHGTQDLRGQPIQAGARPKPYPKPYRLHVGACGGQQGVQPLPHDRR